MTAMPSNPNIKDLLPHSGRMLLIDEIVEIDRESAVSRSTVNREWPLSAGRGSSPLMIIELVAQTSGLSNGLDRIAVQGQDADKKGWLVGIKRAIFLVDYLPMGAEIVTTAKNSFKFEGFREIEGYAKIGPDLVGEVTLQVVQADQE